MDVQLIENCDSDLQITRNCETDFKLVQNNNRNIHIHLQQNQKCDTYLQQTPNFDCDLQSTQNCEADLKLIQNSHTDLQQSRNADFQVDLTDLHQNKNCDNDLQQVQNCRSDLQQNQNYHTDLQKNQNCQQNSILCVKSESFDINSNSTFSPLDSTKNSEPSGDNLEHPNSEGDLTNHSNEEEMTNFTSTMADEICETPDSGICTYSCSEDLKRSKRISKRKRDLEEFCPVCGVTVRYSELESHFAKEVDNLSNISKNIRRPRMGNREKEGVKITFVQVKCNRENRLAAKVAKYSKKNEVHCPVCRERLTGSEIEVNEHVLNCMNEEDNQSEVNVVDHDSDFEEYEIGGETRIRTISLIPGGYRSLHGQSSKSKPADDDDDDLNVDVDDTLTYGKAQYTELDVIHNQSDATEVKELELLRRAVISDPAVEPHVIECKKWPQNSEIQNEIAIISGSSSRNVPESNTDEISDTKDQDQFRKSESNIISCLRAKIKDLEQQKNVKCLICFEPYTKPVVATTCWHVHCEECWLVSMGVKKLCPQCNTIVFPSNLRRIYL